MCRSFLCQTPFLILFLCSTVRGASPLCEPSTTRLCLQSGRIAVEADFQNFAGNKFSIAPAKESGLAKKVKFNEDTGFFWYLDPEQLAILVKVLDGRSINEHFWVFLASTSNFEFNLTVEDLETGTKKQYHNPPGLFAGFQDVRALKAPSESSGTQSSQLDQLQSAFSTKGTLPGSGHLDQEELYLFNNRFEISVEWRDFSGQSGPGLPLSLSDSTGAFYFFSQNNLDLLVRVADGREKNGNFWFFLGGVTNVQYRLWITDTVTGHSKLYFNPLSQFRTWGDNGPFVPNVYLAQFGGGAGFGTSLALVNMSDKFDADVLLSFFSENGSTSLPPTVSVRIGDTEMDTEQLLQITPHGSLTVSTNQAGDDLWLGSAEIETNQPLVAQVRYEIEGKGASATGAGHLTRSALVPVRRRSGDYNSGLAIQNAFEFPTTVSLELLDALGDRVTGGFEELSLAPHERTSKFLDELFPRADVDSFQGSVFVTANDELVSLISLELGKKQGDFTSISVVSLP